MKKVKGLKAQIKDVEKRIAKIRENIQRLETKEPTSLNLGVIETYKSCIKYWEAQKQYLAMRIGK